MNLTFQVNSDALNFSPDVMNFSLQFAPYVRHIPAKHQYIQLGCQLAVQCFRQHPPKPFGMRNGVFGLNAASPEPFGIAESVES